jgi:O-antigen/teichoic acid export membrane protein
VVLTRHLGVHRFGQYTTIISVATLAVMLADAGLSTLATREYVSYEEQGQELMRDLLGMRVVLTSLAVAASTLFAVIAGYDSIRVAGTVLATIGLGISSVQAFEAVPLIAKLRLGWVSVIELIRQAVLVSLIVLLVVVNAGLLPVLGALIPSSLVALGITRHLVRGAMPARPSLRVERVVPLIRATFVFSIATGLGVGYAFTAQVLTSLVASPEQTGLFAAAFRLFSVVIASAGLLINSAFPVLARAARDDLVRLAFALQKLFDVAVILGVGAAIAAVTGGDAIIAVIAGPRYAASAAILRIEGTALLASFILAVLGYALISMRRHTALVVSNGLALLVTAVLTVILAAADGGRGAAIGVVAGEWTLAACYLVGLARANATLLPRPTVAAKVILASGPSFALMLLRLPGGWRMCVALMLYLAGIVALRAIPRELYELVPWRG